MRLWCKLSEVRHARFPGQHAQLHLPNTNKSQASKIFPIFLTWSCSVFFLILLLYPFVITCNMPLNYTWKRTGVHFKHGQLSAYLNLGAQGCEWGSPHSCILTVTVEGDYRKNLGGKCPFSVVLVLYVNRRSSCAGFWFLIIISCVFSIFSEQRFRVEEPSEPKEPSISQKKQTPPKSAKPSVSSPSSLSSTTLGTTTITTEEEMSEGEMIQVKVPPPPPPPSHPMLLLLDSFSTKVTFVSLKSKAFSTSSVAIDLEASQSILN